MAPPSSQCWNFPAAICESFNEIVADLRHNLEKRGVPDRPDVAKSKGFILLQDIKALLKDCIHGKNQIKRLFALTEEGVLTRVPSDTHPSLARAKSGSPAETGTVGTPLSAECTPQAEAFWQAIVEARMKLFTILLFCNVKIESEVWHNFFHRTVSAFTSDGEPFDDDLLPLAATEVEPLFGCNEQLNESIYARQSLVCVLEIDKPDITVGQEEAKVLRLPFISEDRIHSCRSEAVGEVYKVEVAEGYFYDSSKFLVRKDVGLDSPEVPILEQLANSTEESRHIVKVKAIIRFPHKTTILEELAEGDLQDLLSNRGDLNGSVFKDKLRIFNEFLGIVLGVMFLHERIRDPLKRLTRKVCAHMDIRPQNVVRVKDAKTGGHLYKLIDFSISALALGSPDSTSFSVPPQGRDCSNRAPECEDDICSELQRHITCACDVWAVGTLLCMCLAWLLDGPDGYMQLGNLLKKARSKTSNVGSNSFFCSVPQEEHLVRLKKLFGPNTLYTTLKTRGPSEEVAIRLNPAIRNYFGDIQTDEDDPQYWLKKFIPAAFAVLEKHCLIPNPAKRSSMAEVYDLLTELVADFEEKSSR